MKELIKHAVTGMFGSGKMEKRIVFESNPDLADNAWPIFKQLLDQNFDSEYKLSWLVREPEKYVGAFEGRNVTFFGYDPASKSSRLNAAKYLLHSRCVVFCNKTVWEPREGQLSLFLGHGTPINVQLFEQRGGYISSAASCVDKNGLPQLPCQAHRF